MLRNSAKSNWLREEVGWAAQLAPVVEGWDGLVGWFVSIWPTDEALRGDPTLKRWRVALTEKYPLNALGR
jgi:hypothetical protein